MLNINREKTLEQLGNNIWHGVVFPTELVKKCFELRRKKLKEFTVEDLRLMITQNIGINYLIPLALEFLSNNILSEGNIYEGDLLLSVLNSEVNFWKSHPEIWNKLYRIYMQGNGKIQISTEINNSIKDKIFYSFNRLSDIMT